MTPDELAACLKLIRPKLPPRVEWPAAFRKDWLVEGWFETDDLVIWSGEPGIGKSVVTLAMALGLASGTPMLGFWPHPTGEPFNIAILDLENKQKMILERLTRLSETLGIDLESIYDKSIKIYSLRGFGLFDSGPIEHYVRNSLERFSPKVMFLDTIISATPQETMGPLDGARFIQRLMKWGRELGSGWQMLSHTKKPNEQVPKNNIIGDQHQSSGGGFVGMADALVLLQKDSSGQIVMTNPKQRHTINSGQYFVRIDDHGQESGPLSVIMSETPMAIPPEERQMFEFLKSKLPAKSSDIARDLTVQFKISERQARRWISSWVTRGLIDSHSQPDPAGTQGGRPPQILSLSELVQIQL